VSNPLRVLLVAYKIRPNMGSEDGSGYYIAAELACRGFDVTLVTRANNVPALRSDPAFDGVELVGIDVPKPLGSFKRGGRGIILYYYLWQLVVGRAVRRLVRARQFDVLRPYGFLLIYALMLSGGLTYLVEPPYRFLVSWLPTK